jgi:hypothetical protein
LNESHDPGVEVNETFEIHEARQAAIKAVGAEKRCDDWAALVAGLISFPHVYGSPCIRHPRLCVIWIQEAAILGEAEHTCMYVVQYNKSEVCRICIVERLQDHACGCSSITVTSRLITRQLEWAAWAKTCMHHMVPWLQPASY